MGCKSNNTATTVTARKTLQYTLYSTFPLGLPMLKMHAHVFPCITLNTTST